MIQSKSMRANYERYGVKGYYEQVAASYHNPHMAGILNGIALALDHLYQRASSLKHQLRALDLACGSGEATIALEVWKRTRSERKEVMAAEIPIQQAQPLPQLMGAARRAPFLLPQDFRLFIAASDPFTQEAYRQRTGRESNRLSFEDVANGKLVELDPLGDRSSEDEAPWDLCICSFAAHLIDTTMLFSVMAQLASNCHFLLILSPTKKPNMNESMGWSLIFETRSEMRVHVRLYQSLYANLQLESDSVGL